MLEHLSALSDEAGDSCQEQIRAIERVGLKFLDLRAMDGFNVSVLPEERARCIRSQLDAAGLQVAMFGSPIGKIDLADDMQGDLDKLRHLGKLADILGCRRVRIFSYYNRKAKLPQKEFRRQALDRLGQLKQLAAKLRLTLYIENEMGIFGEKCGEMELLARTFRDGADGVVRLIFDFDNYNVARENVWENWLKLREVTDAFHLKDSVWADDQTLYHVPVGQGQGAVKKILADAVRRGWTGPLTVEPHLQHSAAVLATGTSGAANATYAKMPAAESFHIACQAARELLQSVDAGQ